MVYSSLRCSKRRASAMMGGDRGNDVRARPSPERHIPSDDDFVSSPRASLNPLKLDPTSDATKFELTTEETFMGQTVQDWECGLCKGDSQCLRLLHVCYMRALLFSEHNLHCDKKYQDGR